MAKCKQCHKPLAEHDLTGLRMCERLQRESAERLARSLEDAAERGALEAKLAEDR